MTIVAFFLKIIYDDLLIDSILKVCFRVMLPEKLVKAAHFMT